MAMPRAPPGTGANITYLQLPDFLAKRFFRFAESCLQTAKELLVLSIGEREIVIGQLTVFLLQFAFHFVPTAFEF
jgi:hypothetical protein